MSSWKSLLLRIGDKCPEYGNTSEFRDHIETCFGALRRELDHSANDILPYLLRCAEQLPHKIPLYGTVVGLLNLENEDFASKLVETTHCNFQEALNSGNCDKIRILTRFLTVMMCNKVLQPGSLVVVFETLLSSAATTVDEEKGNPSWQACADFYVTCILACLPWGGAELTEQVPEEIERVMAGVQAYLSIRRRAYDPGLSFFEDDDESVKGPGEKDFLEDLWGRIQVLSSNGWKLDSVPRPHLSFEAQLVAGKSHEFGPISCPEQPHPPSPLSGAAYGKQKHDAELKYPQRIRRLNIFPDSKIEDLQPIDRFIVEEYLLDVLLFLNGSRKECASFMVGLPVPFRYEYLMAETIFSQLLLLPHPPFKPIYYTLVIMDLCKALPGAFPAVVAGAVRALFEKIADLDMECRTRLILWFSHHLSNFQFIWPWEEWAYVLELPKWAPQRAFVQEVLEREVRLSYWEKVKQSIENAPALEELLPPKGGPDFKYSGEDGKEHALSAELSSKVKGRQSAREIISWIEESVFPVNGFEVTLRVVVQTFLNIGSKSFTHLITVLERYGQVIAKLCPDQDKQVMLIVEVSSYWKNNAQMTAIAIDRMMGYRLISNLAIVRWVFSPANIEQFHISDRPWEVLRNAVSKTYNRICDLRKEISSLKKGVVSAEEAAAKAKAELEGAESKLTLVDGEPVLGENPVRMKQLKSNAEKTKDEEVSARDSLEAKEALLARALDENGALFLSLYKNFTNVLMERLPDASRAGTLWALKSIHANAMVVDLEESVMEVDNENGKPKNSQVNGRRASNFYNVGEKEQWCLSTLSYVKSFSRQYASEIWPHIDKLDAEVLTEDVHPLIRSAVYYGLRWPISEA
ncbi:MIF4G domain-containing protein/MIF4G_like domain-containing protein/MIF4G_like_2 domain-containing protein [Cephalotus follicularis]|uniref:Nuclear cap-binding protein subunit 1 n=1 Tax=Cephalotus follicularis TaxID=3775 RepID=A0A1Q3C5A7_CEPFO|nr:MIF4G domain-containing protein/MIF4G_like domain-containing protein/MIF4G_like_2 domain-containing protein [Cephalotus follicularis]